MWLPLLLCYTICIFEINAYQHYNYQYPHLPYHYQPPSSTPQVSRLDKKNNFIQKAVKTIHKLKHNLSTTVKNILSGRVRNRQDFGFNTNSYHYRPLSYATNVSRFHKKNNLFRNAAKSIHKSFNNFSTLVKNIVSGRV